MEGGGVRVRVGGGGGVGGIGGLKTELDEALTSFPKSHLFLGTRSPISRN